MLGKFCWINISDQQPPFLVILFGKLLSGCLRRCYFYILYVLSSKFHHIDLINVTEFAFFPSSYFTLGFHRLDGWIAVSCIYRVKQYGWQWDLHSRSRSRPIFSYFMYIVMVRLMVWILTVQWGGCMYTAGNFT